MSTKDLGNRLTCQSCGAKFYDLKKKNVACPKCDAAYAPEKPKTRRASPAAPKAAVEKAPKEVKPKSTDGAGGDVDAAIEEVADIEVEDTGDDGDNNHTLIEGTLDIGGDDDDIAGVAVNVDNGDKD